MAMGNEDVAHALRTEAVEERLNVSGVVGARINHRHRTLPST